MLCRHPTTGLCWHVLNYIILPMLSSQTEPIQNTHWFLVRSHSPPLTCLLPPPPQDLPFKRGDTLTIISASKDPNWYKARRADGLEGMIPFNYVQAKKSPSGEPLPSSGTASSPTKVPSAVVSQKTAVKLQSMPWVCVCCVWVEWVVYVVWVCVGYCRLKEGGFLLVIVCLVQTTHVACCVYVWILFWWMFPWNMI